MICLALKDINMLKSVKTKLKKAFKITDLGIISNILGIKVQHDGETEKIRLSQQNYVDELCEKFDMRNTKTVTTPIESNVKMSKEMCPQTEDEKRETEKRPYRELIGSLIYLANAMRSDTAFAASTLSCFYANPGYELAPCKTRTPLIDMRDINTTLNSNIFQLQTNVIYDRLCCLSSQNQNRL